MKRYRYVVEYNGKLYVIDIKDYEKDGMVVIDLVLDDYVIKYVNEKGEDRVTAYLNELWITDANDGTIEEFMTNISYMLNYGEILAIIEIEKQVMVK